MPLEIMIIDDVSPVTGTVALNGYTNDTTPLVRVALAGAGAAIGDTVVVTHEDFFGGPQATVASLTLSSEDLARGYVEVQLPALGAHWHLVAATLSGAETATASSVFAVSTAPPAPPEIVAAIDDVGPVQGEFISGAATDDAEPAFRVFVADRPPLPTGSPGHPTPFSGNAMNFDSQVQLLKDGAPVATITLAGFFGNEFEITSPNLAPGAHTFTAVAIDRAGNVSAPSAPFTVFIEPAAGVELTAGDAGEALAGGQGPDTLISGAGADTLTGGAGADLFVFAIQETVTGTQGSVELFRNGQSPNDRANERAWENYYDQAEAKGFTDVVGHTPGGRALMGKVTLAEQASSYASLSAPDRIADFDFEAGDRIRLAGVADPEQVLQHIAAVPTADGYLLTLDGAAFVTVVTTSLWSPDWIDA